MPAAVGAWAAAAVLTSVAPWWSFAAAAGLAGAAAVAWSRPGLAVPLVAVAVVALGCGWRLVAVQSSPVAALASRGAVVQAEVVLREDGRVFEGRAGPGTVLTVTITSIRTSDRAWQVRVRATAFVEGAPAGMSAGVRLSLRTDLEPSTDSDEAALLRVLQWREVSAGSWWWRGADVVRQSIRDGVDHRDDQAAALVPALVAGDESALTEQTRERFARTGLTHLLAVSGANLTIVLGVVIGIARAGGRGRRTVLVLGLMTVVGFVVVARPEPSVQRAAVMGAVALAGTATGSRGAGLRALGWAVVALLVVDPWLSTRAGFVLSVLATAGIIAFAPVLARRMAWLPAPIAQALAVPLAAQIACQPVVTALSGEVSLVGVFANLVAAPAVAPATVLGLAAGLVDLVIPPLAVLPGELAWWSATVIVAVARWGAELPGAAIAWSHPWWTLLPVLAVTGWAIWRLARRPALVVVLVTALVAAMVRPPTPGWPPHDVVTVDCDVGQGDGFVVPTAPGEAIVIDVGEDPGPIDRCLRDLDVDRIALLLFSHADADHVAGWSGAVGGRRVDLVVVGPSGGPAVAGVPRRELAAGDVLTVRDTTIEVLWPRPGQGAVPDDQRNDVSLAVRVTRLGHRLLFVGDLGEEAQRGLARLQPDLGAEVFKVAHHGSADQWPDLIARVAPSVALIGVGADNSYGHPAPAVVAGLEARGISLWRTDRDGTVAVVDRDGALAVVRR